MKHLAPLLIISGLLASCSGSDSNPLEKYAGLKSAPPSDQVAETQTIAPPDLFDIKISGSNGVNQGHFIEGQNSQLLILVNSKSTKVLRYTIEMIDFTTIDRPTLSQTKDAQAYSLQWTPSVGIIPPGEFGMTLSAKFLVTVVDAENKVLIGLTKVADLNIIVSRNNTQPIIKGRTDLKAGIDEGVATEFTVDVDDVGGIGSPRFAEMSITPYNFSNTEAYRADGSRYLAPIKYVKEGNSYRFFFSLDVDHLPLDRDRLGHEIPSATSVDLCFLMRAVSAVGTMSEQSQVCTVARYAAQPLQFSFNQQELDSIKSGQENIINFKVSAAHSLSVITLPNPSQQIAGLSGQKSIDCNYENAEKKNSGTCTIKWTPTCQKTTSTKSVIFKAENQVGEKTKASAITQVLTVLPNPEVCFPAKVGVK